jgi:hypothetical protein
VKNFFVEQSSRGITIALSADRKSNAIQRSNANQPANLGKGGKRKWEANNPSAKKKMRETSDKSLKMGLF